VAQRVIHLVLIVSADAERLRRRHRLVRAAGYHALPAPAVGHALALARKARPSVVLADANLHDERALALLLALRELEELRQVHVILFGVLTPEEHAHVARDLRARVHDDDDDDERLLALLREVLVA